MVIRKLDEKVVEQWKSGDYSLEAIGKLYGVTRQAVKRYLNRRGVDTDKGQGWKEVKCEICGKVEKRPRCLRRGRNKTYCSSACYVQSMRNPVYEIHRQSQRVARRKVGEVFVLKEGYVVHHRDTDVRNNAVGNLMVFRNQGDHMRWHRAGGEESGVG